jgi:hypothetical protein
MSGHLASRLIVARNHPTIGSTDFDEPRAASQKYRHTAASKRAIHAKPAN